MIPILARVGEDGFVHQINTGIDASADFVSCTFHYTLPDATVTDKTCAVLDAASGNYGWTVTAAFFTEGVWQLQATIDRGASGDRKLKHPIVFRIGGSGE